MIYDFLSYACVFSAPDHPKKGKILAHKKTSLIVGVSRSGCEDYFDQEEVYVQLLPAATICPSRRFLEFGLRRQSHTSPGASGRSGKYLLIPRWTGSLAIAYIDLAVVSTESGTCVFLQNC
jgi:hypothetical protein